MSPPSRVALCAQELLADASARWCSQEPSTPASEWSWCGGPALSYFQDEYVYSHELFPLHWIRWYPSRRPPSRSSHCATRQRFSCTLYPHAPEALLIVLLRSLPVRHAH